MDLRFYQGEYFQFDREKPKVILLQIKDRLAIDLLILLYDEFELIEF